VKTPRPLGILANEAGNALIVTALTIPILIGSAGLATDTVQWSLWKRELQREADSAALAGAYAKAQSAPSLSAATAEINRRPLVTLYGTPIVEIPTTGTYANNVNAVHVKLSTRQRLPFSAMFMRNNPPIVSAEATAAYFNNGLFCVLALDNSATTGLTMLGNSTVNLGCGMAADSTGANAVTASGSSTVYATPISAVGGIPSSSNYAPGTQLLPGSSALDDPYANLPNPVLPACGAALSVNSNKTQSVANPTGVTCFSGGININGTVTFAPGIYYVDGGVVSFGAQASVTGAGVTFILTSATAATNPSSIATLSINGGATINLTPMATGPYAGILFYQDRRAQDSGTNKVNGNASSVLEGAFYFPSQALQFNGTSGMVSNCIQIIAKRVTFTGNTSITNNCPVGSGAHAISTAHVRLVG
jgi:hypothetical protein